jgi:predicted alpha/beta-hydrolase family hydrolase
LFTVLALATAPISLFAIVVILTPWSSWSARSYGLAVVAINAGFFMKPPRRATWLGAALIVAVVAVRLISAASGQSMTMTCAHVSGRWLARPIDERDAAIWGARIAFASGHFRDPDTPAVVPALIHAYEDLSAHEGDVPSPVVPTYLGLERRGATDVLAFDAVGSRRAAFIFLHGFGGSFTLPCWQLAHAVAEVGFVTRCPSLGPRGDWWSAEGEAIVRDTIRDLRAEGIDHVVLAGLSNGGVGAARLAPKMRGAIHGLVLIAGTAPAAAPGVPVLVLQGARDSMMPASAAREYAIAHGGTYVDLNGGHFALLLERQRALAALTSWLLKH